MISPLTDGQLPLPWRPPRSTFRLAILISRRPWLANPILSNIELKARRQRVVSAGDRPLYRERGLNALPAKKTGSSSMANVSVQAMKSHIT